MATNSLHSLSLLLELNQFQTGTKYVYFEKGKTVLFMTDSCQSVANTFSDEQIQIWILFAIDIFYKYEYEYYSWHHGSQIWIRKLIKKIFTNKFKYSNIFEYLKKSNLRVLLPTSPKIVHMISKTFCNFPYRYLVKYLKKNSCFFLTIIGELGV